ncbi:unnamed protein product, partial [Ectocarpus sp. 12 AP-2014]
PAPFIRERTQPPALSPFSVLAPLHFPLFLSPASFEASSAPPFSSVVALPVFAQERSITSQLRRRQARSAGTRASNSRTRSISPSEHLLPSSSSRNSSKSAGVSSALLTAVSSA